MKVSTYIAIHVAVNHVFINTLNDEKIYVDSKPECNRPRFHFNV